MSKSCLASALVKSEPTPSRKWWAFKEHNFTATSSYLSQILPTYRERVTLLPAWTMPPPGAMILSPSARSEASSISRTSLCWIPPLHRLDAHPLTNTKNKTLFVKPIMASIVSSVKEKNVLQVSPPMCVVYTEVLLSVSVKDTSHTTAVWCTWVFKPAASL